VLLYSNEVEFTLPVPEEILSAIHKPKSDEDSIESHDLEDGDVPARELLLVAERVIPQSSVTEQSGIEKLSLKSVASKLQTIPEGQQLDIMVAEDDAGNMENVPGTENGAAEAEPPEQQSGLQEQTDATVVDEHIPVDDNDVHLQGASHETSLPQDDANSELVFELDATVFRDRGESVSVKDANLEPLKEETEEEEIETQLLGRDAGEEDLTEHTDVDEEILNNERNDDDSLDQQGNNGNGSSKEVPDPNEVTYQATNENDKTEVESKLDNEADTFGMERISEQSDSDVDEEILDNERNDDDSSEQHGNQGNGSSGEVPDQNEVTYQATNENDKTEVESKLDNEEETVETEQSDSDFWDHGEKQREEGIAKEATVTPAADSGDNGQALSHASTQSDIEYHESNHAADFQEHLDIKTHDTDTRKEHFEQEYGYPEGLEKETDTGNNRESQAKDNVVGLDANDDGLISELISKRNAKEKNSPNKDKSNSDLEEASNTGNDTGGDDDTSTVNAEISEKWQEESEENAKLSVEETDAEEPKECRGYKKECYDKGDDPELKVEKVNQLDEQVERGLERDQLLEKFLTGTDELLQEPQSNISKVENQDISLSEGEEDGENQTVKWLRENSTIDENVNSAENQLMAKQELKSEHFRSDEEHSTDDVTNETKPTGKGDKQTHNEAAKDTWSASSNLGSVKNEDDDSKDEMESTDMPTFEEATFEGGVLSSRSNIENNDGLQQVDKEHEISDSKRIDEIPWGEDSLQGEISSVVL